MECTIIRKESTFILQKNFRAVMNAFAWPSRIFHVQPLGIQGAKDVKADLCVSILDVFIDHQTSYFIDFRPDDAAPTASRGAALASSFLNGTRAPHASEADFVVFWDGSSGGGIRELKRGNLEYPDEGATAVYMVDAILGADEPAEDPGNPFVFQASGPGIPSGKGRYSIRGLDPREIGMIAEANGGFPLGVDVLFVDTRGNVAGLPRSSKIGAR